MKKKILINVISTNFLNGYTLNIHHHEPFSAQWSSVQITLSDVAFLASF